MTVRRDRNGHVASGNRVEFHRVSACGPSFCRSHAGSSHRGARRVIIGDIDSHIFTTQIDSTVFGIGAGGGMANCPCMRTLGHVVVYGGNRDSFCSQGGDISRKGEIGNGVELSSHIEANGHERSGNRVQFHGVSGRRGNHSFSHANTIG